MKYFLKHPGGLFKLNISEHEDNGDDYQYEDNK